MSKKVKGDNRKPFHSEIIMYTCLSTNIRLRGSDIGLQTPFLVFIELLQRFWVNSIFIR